MVIMNVETHRSGADLGEGGGGGVGGSVEPPELEPLTSKK